MNDAVDLARKAGKRAPRASSTRCCAASAASATRLPLPPRPADPARPRGGRSRICRSRCRTRAWLVARWLDRHGFDAAESVGAVRQRARAADAARQYAADVARGAGRLARDARGRDASRRAFAPDGLVVRSGNPLLTPLAAERPVRRPGRSLAARRAADRPRRRASGCSTPARHRAARPPRWRRRWRTAALIVAADVRGRRVDLLSRTVSAAGATCVRIVQADAPGALPFGRRVRLRAARRALLRPRHAPPRSRHPVAAHRRTSCRRSPPTQLAMLGRTAEVVEPGGRLDLRDLLERAGRERGGRRAVFWPGAGLRRGPARVFPSAPAVHQPRRALPDLPIPRPARSVLCRHAGEN